jgi:hypothetical protein
MGTNAMNQVVAHNTLFDDLSRVACEDLARP